MGNTMIEACMCQDKKEVKSSRYSQFAVHSFKDKHVKVLDFTGAYQSVNNIQELFEIMPEFLPYEIKLFSGKLIDSPHSFVTVYGLYSDKAKIERILIEIYYNERKFLINIKSGILNTELNRDLGNLEYLYVFKGDIIFGKSFKDF